MTQKTRVIRPSRSAGLAGGLSLLTAFALFSVVLWIAADSVLERDPSGPFITTAKVEAHSLWT